MPDWAKWSNLGKLAAVVPGLIGLFLAVRKAWLDRSLLAFTIRATNVEADEDEPTHCFVDGVGMVPTLKIDATDNGVRPITIQRFECVFAFKNKNQEWRESKSTAWVDKKIAQGDHCFGFPKVHTAPSEIISACAIDSTGKRWPVPSSKIKELNALGPKPWS